MENQTEIVEVEQVSSKKGLITKILIAVGVVLTGGIAALILRKRKLAKLENEEVMIEDSEESIED